mgnify:CR=1 FL=1
MLSACAASVWTSTPASTAFTASTIRATGWTAPTSLFASMIETRAVLPGLTAAASVANYQGSVQAGLAKVRQQASPWEQDDVGDVRCRCAGKCGNTAAFYAQLGLRTHAQDRAMINQLPVEPEPDPKGALQQLHPDQARDHGTAEQQHHHQKHKRLLTQTGLTLLAGHGHDLPLPFRRQQSSQCLQTSRNPLEHGVQLLLIHLGSVRVLHRHRDRHHRIAETWTHLIQLIAEGTGSRFTLLAKLSERIGSPCGEQLGDPGRTAFPRPFNHRQTDRQDLLHQGQAQLVEGIGGCGFVGHGA